MSDLPKVFQIGFNKCATKSLASLFLNAGHKSVHYKIRIQRGLRVRIAQIMEDNLAAGQKLFHGHEDIVFYSDMEANDAHRRFDGYKYFAQIDAEYPGSKFLLNLRDKAGWIRSRLSHERGQYVVKYMASQGLDDVEACKALWAEDWDQHIAAVRAYFADRPGQLVEFDIQTGNIADLIAAFPEYRLDATQWHHIGLTSKNRAHEN